MAGLFGSGPTSNILNTVSGSYNDMLNAERQKGQAAHEAMGAFGKAISPKVLGMNKFKNDFKNADWSKPETYARAGEQIMQFDPAAGLSMLDKGRSLAASMAPKRDMELVSYTDAEGNQVQEWVDKNAVATGSTYGTVKEDKESPLSVMVTDMTGFAPNTSDHRKAMVEESNKVKKVQNTISPIEQVKTVTGFITNDPNYKAAKANLMKVGTGLDLMSKLTGPDANSKAATLLERTVSEAYNSDTRAASEIDRLVQNRSWSDGVSNWISNGFEGVPTAGTLEEYNELLLLMEEGMTNTINKTVEEKTNLYSPYVDEAAIQNIKEQYTAKVRPKIERADPNIPTTRAVGKATGKQNGRHRLPDGTFVQVYNGVAYELN